jgi:ribonuclease HII
MRHAGIDEAGYGPLLGPLAIVRVGVEAEPGVDWMTPLRSRGAADSKAVHDSQNLGPLEWVALPAITWLAGFQPDTAADVFALLEEDSTQREGIPWMAGAKELRLPVAPVAHLPQWSFTEFSPAGLGGALIHPGHLNRATLAGTNRATVEWEVVQRQLAKSHGDAPCETVVDRLGGRKFYADGLKEVLPGGRVDIREELPEASRYRLWRADGTDAGSAAFLVGGETASAATAVASCIAKYARELHMLLLNRYWSGKLPWLKPTAGYPQDAKRWLHQLGTGYTGAWGPELVRGVLKATEDVHG